MTNISKNSGGPKNSDKLARFKDSCADGAVATGSKLAAKFKQVDSSLTAVDTQPQKPFSLLKAHQIGIIPESERNPEILYTKDGEATAAIVLLTFLLMKPKISTVVKSTDKPVICGEKLCNDLWRTFSNALACLPYTEENRLPEEANGASQQYIGYADFYGPIAVTQGGEKYIKEIQQRTADFYYALFYARNDRPSGAHIEHAARTSIAAVLDIQDSPKKQIEMMERIQKIRFLRRVPETLCHEIGHLFATETALVAGSSDKSIKDHKKEWSSFVTRFVDVERKKAQFDANPKNAEDFEYFFSDIRETTAQLIGEALLEDTSVQTGISFYTNGYAQMLPESYKAIFNMVQKIKSPKIYSFNPYDPEDIPEPELGKA